MKKDQYWRKNCVKNINSISRERFMQKYPK